MTELFEHQRYRPIPGTRDTYREDPGNTNTLTLQHSHVYAGNSKNQLYSVNVDGTGHDGSKGILMPQKHADFFRTNKNYKINSNNILEQLEAKSLILGEHKLYIFTESE